VQCSVDAAGAAPDAAGTALAGSEAVGAGGRSADKNSSSDNAGVFAACPDELLRSALQLVQSATHGYEAHCAAQAERKRQAAQRANAGL
jgi:hypothetical protein